MCGLQPPAMSDVLEHPEAPAAPEHVAIYRKDYRPPDWLVPEVALDFELDPERTRVRATLRSRATATMTGRCGWPAMG